MGLGTDCCQEDSALGSEPDPAAAGLAILSLAQTWAHDRHVPLNATVEITQRCNLRCKHCYNFDRDLPRARQSDREGQGADRELTTPEILALIEDLHGAGC